ncbi:MAG: hypothetical protein FD133_847 [Erysipelotrichaceae bacterium]|nr:MAG: hypothetical protein FD133_847 [Erysipelotrichaceae bacterium]
MDEQARISVILVVYQSLIENSNAYNSIREHSDHFNVIVIDNSTQEIVIQNNHDFSVRNNIRYISKGKNLGLSKAYNLGLDMILENPDFGNWMITLDQDTHLPFDYLDEVLKISQCTPHEDVYCPNVISAQGEISPIILRRDYTANFHMSGIEYLGCINSGLMWSVGLVKSLRYDEHIFLDMVDYDIFMQLYTNNRLQQVVQMKSTIRQEFSGDQISTFIKDKTRFMIYAKDFVYFCRKWSIRRTFCCSVLMKRALKLSISHRSMFFLFYAIQVMQNKD